MKRKILLTAIIYASSIFTNLAVHNYDFWLRYKVVIQPIPDGLRRIYTPNEKKIIDFQKKSLNEIILENGSLNPWSLVPGSFLWRRPEKPYLDLEFQEKSHPHYVPIQSKKRYYI